METFDRLESEVRSYIRAFPTVFLRSLGAKLWDRQGREYIDFFSGAGTLNYGHNNPRFKKSLIEYLQGDGIVHSLDMATEAKERFLEKLEEVVFRPRGLEYRVQFTGPTGTNAVEAALKAARKATGRRQVLFFCNGFHGMTLGALAVTGNALNRAGAGVSLQDALPLPFDGELGPDVDTLDYLEAQLENPGRGYELPAAAILETVQAEGGVKVARVSWLQRLERLLKRHGILLIVDDIQVGCGRTGEFFSFEQAGLSPDFVCLSKSLSGFGLPMSIVLIKPDLDFWRPGEHSGTFRGNNLAFVTASEALTYWQDDNLTKAVDRNSRTMRRRLLELAQGSLPAAAEVRGRGMIMGLDVGDPALVSRVCREAFQRGLIIESAGPSGEVLKLLPPLTIDSHELESGLSRIEECFDAAAMQESSSATAPAQGLG